MADELVLNDGGGDTMTSVCCGLASTNIIKLSAHQRQSEHGRVRTPNVDQNPLTHDPSGRIREVYTLRHTW